MSAPKMAGTLLLLLLAGCVEEAAGPSASERAAGTGAAAHAVLAILDSGINPYHAQFRDASPEAFRHPSTYLPGYPADAVALSLSLNETDFTKAVLADCAVWNGVEPGRWYWVPGTRIVGVWIAEEVAEAPSGCGEDALPVRFLDTYAPHGTGAAGRAAGGNTSLCPECKIVMFQSPQTTHAMERLSREPWIDLQSNSWAAYEDDMAPPLNGRGPHELARQATERMVTFAASGNGMRFRAGLPTGDAVGVDLGLGIPTYLRPAQGHEGVLVVGGHDNGRLILWPGTMPHVVADAWNTPSAAWNQTTQNGTFGGTSGATPFAAGAFARMVLEARRMVGDAGTGLREGDLVVAAEGAALPAEGPLSDGRLSRDEAERLFLVTARPRPVEEKPYDGGLGCPPPCFSLGRGTNLPVEWGAVPGTLPAYYFLGYGQVGVGSLERALAVLRGEEPAPERGVEDRFFEADAQVRRTLQE